MSFPTDEHNEEWVDTLLGPKPAFEVPTDVCDCEDPEGYFTSGVPGILAHTEGKLITSTVERCDVCQKFPSDGAALCEVVRLGYTVEVPSAGK